MRIFKGLDNIHAVIDRHESEWRRENGEPEPPQPDIVVDRVRGRFEALDRQFESGRGRFDEERFSRSGTPAKKKAPEAPVITPESTQPAEIAKLSADRFLGGSESETVTANEPEAVEIVKNKEGRHSWLYNEVMKAINDASKGTSAKIIAVFVPVVQNSKEFEDLPAAETVTTSPIDESLAKVEVPVPVIAPENVMPAENEAHEESPSAEDFNLIPEIQPEQKAEIAETLREMEEKFDEVLQEEKEAESESESEIVAEELTPAIFADEAESEQEILQNEPEAEIVAEELTPAIFADEAESEQEILPNEPEAEIVTEELAPVIFADESESEQEILQNEPEAETLTEKAAPEITTDESEPEIQSVAEILENDSDNDIFTEELSQAITMPEYETEDTSDILQDGEQMDFEELSLGYEELKLPDELDDDEIADKKPIAEDDEIEIVPDPVK